MTYLVARNSGRPFNRRKYKDGWYIRDLYRNVDYAMIDLSQRFWSENDLAADDWWTKPISDTEALIDDSMNPSINKGEEK